MRRLQMPISLLATAVLASCAVDVIGPEEEAPPTVREPTRTSPMPRMAGRGIVPHEHPELWPFQVASPRIVVHYQAADEQATAAEVLGHVEHAWQVQIVQGGALPPLDDQGAAGPDGRFDVYLQRGIAEPYVVGVEPNLATWYEDWSTSMVVDPWGEYGGAALESNIFHELRHASQASDDWWEHPHVFEADATAWEVTHYGLAHYATAWQHYQERPEWTLFRNDQYRTWYMYGGALFLLYLRDHVFHGSLAFTNDMWRRSRNAPGAEQDPSLNEPDFVDALQAILAENGTSLFAQIVGFARARWYTGARANGSFPGGAELPEVDHRTHTRKARAKQTSFFVLPQMLGTSYVVVTRAPTDPAVLWLSLSAKNQGASFVVQAVGGAAPDATLDLGSGPAPVSFGSGSAVTLAITPLPANGVFDPDLVGNAAVSAWLTLSTTR